MTKLSEDIYENLNTYEKVYRELTYQRNEAILFLKDNQLWGIKRGALSDEDKRHHRTAQSFRHAFLRNIREVIAKLYDHDAIEALYAVENYDLGEWDDTEANRLEKEIEGLKIVLSDLQKKYSLTYKLRFEYIPTEATILLNGVPALKFGENTLRHKLMSALWSDKNRLWGFEDINDYFVDHFNYQEGELKDRNIEKLGIDINKELASKSSVNDLLAVTNSTVRVNPTYLPLD